MDMSGTRRIPAPRQRVWEGLNDPEILKASIPGCETLEKLSDTEMKATAAIKIGPISARFAGKVQLTDLDPPNSYNIGGEGQGGVAGFAKGGANVKLTDEADGITLLTYDVKAQVGGKIAQLGARLIDASAKQMADAFFDRFSAQVATPEPVAEVVAEPLASIEPAAMHGDTPSVAPAAIAMPVPPRAAVTAPSAPASISLFDMMPKEPFGFPLVAWGGGFVFLLILLLLFV